MSELAEAPAAGSTSNVQRSTFKGRPEPRALTGELLVRCVLKEPFLQIVLSFFHYFPLVN